MILPSLLRDVVVSISAALLLMDHNLKCFACCWAWRRLILPQVVTYSACRGDVEQLYRYVAPWSVGLTLYRVSFQVVPKLCGIYIC